MILCFLGDTHGQHEKVLFKGPIEMIFHTGDFVYDHTSIDDYINFIKWYGNLNIKHKILIAGNHETFLDSDLHGNVYKDDLLNLMRENNIHYLENESITLEGLKIYGSPNTPKFYDWAFMKSRGLSLQENWNNIPLDTDILLTHGPPFGIGDKTEHGELTGCIDLLNKVMNLPDLKYHAFGHIHHSSGIYTANQLGTRTRFVNGSILNDSYIFKNQPKTFWLR